MRKIFIGTSAIAALTLPLVAVVACANTSQKQEIKPYERAKSFAASEYKIDGSKDIIDFNNAADINLYYTSYGTIAYNYMLKLALNSLTNTTENGATKRSEKEVHFAYSPDSQAHQAKMNTKYFETLLKTRNQNSTVINMHDDVMGNVVNKWREIIEKNPTKKINIWWNSDHINHLNGSPDLKIMDLVGYKNVNVQLIEDGAAVTYKAQVMSNKNIASQFTTPGDVIRFDGDTQYFAQNIFENVYSWFSSTIFDQFKSTPGFERVKTFDSKELSDKLFDLRININADDVSKLTAAEGSASTLVAGDQRIFRAWPIVSGLNWQDSLKVLHEATVQRQTKNMILLGSYGADWEDSYIRSVWERYHNEYNIFYKGHPGHNEHSNFVQNVLINQEKREGMYLLESAIPSEELTRDHFLEGMKFDAVISVGQTSAMDGFPKEFTNTDGTKVSGYDLDTQYLEIAQPSNGATPTIIGNPKNHLYDGDKANEAAWENISNWLKTSGWL